MITSRYNHTLSYLRNKGVDNITAKVVLLDSSTFTATHTELSELAGTQQDGFGWDSGGEALANFTSSVFDTDHEKIDFDDLSVDISGGTLSATHAVIIDDDGVDPQVLWFYDFEGTIDANSGSPFKVIPPTNGLFNTSDPA